MPRRRGKRNRERRSKRIERSEWWYRGRAVVVVEVTSKGPLVVTRVDRNRVDAASREAAAFWLNQILTRLTHDDCYAMLWGTP